MNEHLREHGKLVEQFLRLKAEITSGAHDKLYPQLPDPTLPV
jgi:hypothetical protein